MRFLPTRIHGIIDYAWGVLLVGAPFLLGFAGDKRALWIAVVFGIAAIVYSAATDYELGLFRLIPMALHLALDAVAGAVLVVIAFAAGLPAAAFWTFLLFGVLAIAASLITRTRVSSGSNGG